MAVRARKPDGSAEVAAQIREYHASLPAATRRVLKALQSEVRAAAPAANPAFSYRMPAFAMDGRIVVWFAGWKEHVSLYPVTRAMQRAAGDALARYRHAKGTLRFPVDMPLPRALIRRLIKARVAEMS
ncbi:MAG TPA: DUF1801 domain-containing protein [Gemmatimonadaceae bacterium]|nr:DUF1801 domain-containing protein [Gemmatimonadaceae bacterium]